MAYEQIVKEKAKEEVVDGDKEVTEEDLRDLKYGSDEVETPKKEDEPSEDTDSEEASEEAGEEAGQTGDQTDSEEETPAEFVKQFPNIKGDTPEEYAKNLETAYQNSTAEALRLKGITETGKDETEEISSSMEVDLSNPLQVYAKQKMDEDMKIAYADFSKQYSQVTDPTEFTKFTTEVATLSNTIYTSQKRLAPPGELYHKAAVILGWEANSVTDKKEQIAGAAKDGAGTSRTSSATKTASKSKVTDDMIAVNRKMYPGKSDTDIRKELEPFIQ